MLKAGRESAGSHLRTFLAFISDTPVLATVVGSLPLYDYNEGELAEKLARGNLGIPDGEGLRASMCLALLRANSDDQKLEQFALRYPLRSSGNWDEMIHEFLESYIQPLYEYLDEQLTERETWISPADIAYDVQTFVDGPLAQRWKGVVEKLQSAYQLLYVASTGSEYAAVGNICRESLIEAATEVFRDEYVPSSEEQPEKGDAKAMVRHALRRGLPDLGDRYRGSVEGMFNATWEYVAVLVHRGVKASNDHARHAVMYSYLAVEALYKLLIESTSSGQPSGTQ